MTNFIKIVSYTNKGLIYQDLGTVLQNYIDMQIIFIGTYWTL